MCGGWGLGAGAWGERVLRCKYAVTLNCFLTTSAVYLLLPLLLLGLVPHSLLLTFPLSFHGPVALRWFFKCTLWPDFILSRSPTVCLRVALRQAHTVRLCYPKPEPSKV